MLNVQCIVLRKPCNPLQVLCSSFLVVDIQFFINNAAASVIIHVIHLFAKISLFRLFRVVPAIRVFHTPSKKADLIEATLQCTIIVCSPIIRNLSYAKNFLANLIAYNLIPLKYRPLTSNTIMTGTRVRLYQYDIF